MSDGKLKAIESITELKPGCILREKNKDGTFPPFADCVILKIENVLNVSHRIKLSRPYAYVSGAGTTSPTVLLGQETFDADFGRIQKLFVQVLTDRENSHEYVT